MFNWRIILIIAICLAALLVVLSGCKGEGSPSPPPETQTSPPASPQPSPTARDISERIASINPALPTSLPDLFVTLKEINNAQNEGTVSSEEGEELEEDLGEKFSSCIKNLVDGIDPADPDSLKSFFDLQKVQNTSEYDKLCDPQTKKYKEDQMKEKFNEWVRNRVNDLDPTDPDSLGDFQKLQKVQLTKKYDDLTTPDTKKYKEDQMKEKFNEWVRNRVNDLDPTDPDSLGDFVKLQKIQEHEKYAKFATTETHQYKETQMKQKFNEYIENLVNDLDPDDPDFEEELQKLRKLQLCEKYSKFITSWMHKWKEEQLESKYAQYVTELVNTFDPVMPGGMQKLDELIKLQDTDTYQELCPESVKGYKVEQLNIKLSGEAGVIPHVVGTLPEHEQENVPVNRSILIAFNQPMEQPSVISALEIYPKIEGDIYWVESGLIMMLKPHDNLEFDTTYTVFIGQTAMSAAGIMLEESFEFSFTTTESAEIPRVLETSPANGQTEISPGQPIEITFDMAMDPESFSEGMVVTFLPPTEFGIYWMEDSTIAVLQPLEPLEADTTYSVTIDAEARSADGIALGKDFSFEFITGFSPAPHVMGTMPLDGQDNITSDYPIHIVFDWPMDPTSVEAALTITPAFDYTTEWSEANFVMTIKPLNTLASLTRYTIQLGSSARSDVGIPIGDTFKITFTSSE
jgi:hypothetical protein